MKVYFLGGNIEEVKEVFKEKCKLKNVDFEFVNIGGKKGMLIEIKEKKFIERKVFVMDKLILKELKKIIWEYIEKLYVRYLNIIGIWVGVYGDI